jgi:ABC-type transport system substrate-binding protein
VQGDFAAVGVRIEPKIMDFSAFKQAMGGTAEAGVGAPLFVVPWYADYGDPDNYLGNLLHTRSAGAPGNWSRYSNAEVDRLLDQARTETDPRKREALYARVDRLALEDAAFLPIYYQGDDLLAGKNVKDLFLSPLGDFAIPLELVRLEN